VTGRSCKAKGSRIEREITELHRDLGVPIEDRSHEKNKGDRVLGPFDSGRGYLVQLTAEIKARKSGEGFAVLDRWLGEHDLLFLRRDRAKPQVLMPWSTYSLMIRRLAETSKGPWADGVPKVEPTRP
jgi:hypothetical protein